MAMLIEFDSLHGLDHPLYWRFNNWDQHSNREPDGTRLPAVARFRAFLSEGAFKSGKHFLEERLVSVVPDGDKDLTRADAYAAFKAQDPSAETGAMLESAKDAQAEMEARIAQMSTGSDPDVLDKHVAEAEVTLDAVKATVADLEIRHHAAAAWRRALKKAKDI